MRTTVLLMIISALSSCLSEGADGERVVVCYYGSWAVYRPGRGRVDVEDLDASLCTHLVYAFAGLRDGVIVSLDPYNDLDVDYGKGAYRRFTALKKRSPALKTLLGIGGWNEGSQKYSQMAATKESRARFVASVVTFLAKFGFDGLDVDWEYPGLRGGGPQDKQNFGLLLEEMRTKFDKHKLLLTAAVSAGKATIDAAYDVSAINKACDLVHVMAYDLHGSWEQFVHHHAALHAFHLDNGTNLQLNVHYAVQYWLGLGLEPGRLVVGVPLYGRCFTLARPDHHDVYDTSYSPGRAGPYTREPGFMGYNEICESEGQQAWAVVRDAAMVAPYAYLERQWCGYDDVQSVQDKAEYVVKLGVAGIVVWSIDTDDIHNTCRQGPFPLITKIKTILQGDQPTPTPTPTPEPETTTDPVTTTTPPQPPPSSVCHREGLNADPQDCTAFYSCHQDGDQWQVFHFHCAAGTVFVEERQVCDFVQDHPDLCHPREHSPLASHQQSMPSYDFKTGKIHNTVMSDQKGNEKDKTQKIHTTTWPKVLMKLVSYFSHFGLIFG